MDHSLTKNRWKKTERSDKLCSAVPRLHLSCNIFTWLYSVKKHTWCNLSELPNGEVSGELFCAEAIGLLASEILSIFPSDLDFHIWEPEINASRPKNHTSASSLSLQICTEEYMLKWAHIWEKLVQGTKVQSIHTRGQILLTYHIHHHDLHLRLATLGTEGGISGAYHIKWAIIVLN